MTFKLLIYRLIIKPTTNLALISLQTYVTKLNIIVRLLILLLMDGLGWGYNGNNNSGYGGVAGYPYLKKFFN